MTADTVSDSTGQRRTTLIRRASFIAVLGNACLALLKIIVGLTSDSLAVVGDGIDSSTDVVIACMGLIVAWIINRPADEEHPWGHGRAETTATAVLSFILFFAGGQLILSAIHDLQSGTERSLPGLWSLVATAISIVGKLLLAWNQTSTGKRAASAMLIANGKNMRGDVVISAGVLFGLGLSILLSQPILDEIVAILVGLWVLKSSVGIFWETNQELMDGSLDRGPYEAVFKAVHSVEGAKNPHRARMRKIGSAWDIDLDIEVDQNINVRKAHGIAAEVERAIKGSVANVYDIVVHVEPDGSESEHDEESFGLRDDKRES